MLRCSRRSSNGSHKISLRTFAQRFFALPLFILVMSATIGFSTAALAEAKTKVFLNGKASAVHFNDGDSFKVLTGSYVGSRARLSGFNTLESFGPVHQWGTWTSKELYVLAKMATLNARRGVWHCESDLSKDTYGRYLWWCKDLVVDQVRKGLAHAMTVTAFGADSDVVAAQQEAIAAKRGIWAHGVPDYVLSSTHSSAEGGGRDGITYNRLVSTADGHSEKWRHSDIYNECEVVCHKMKTFKDEELTALAKILVASTDENVKKVLELDGKRLLAAAQKDAKDLAFYQVEAAKTRFLNQMNFGQPGWVVLDYEADEAKQKSDAKIGTMMSEKMRDVLLKIIEENPIASESEEQGACVVHVDFRRRFGGRRASCLK